MVDLQPYETHNTGINKFKSVTGHSHFLQLGVWCKTHMAASQVA